MTPPPWSFSSLTSFETCPKRYYHIKVAKDVLDVPGDAAVWGSEVHTKLEARVRDGTSLPVSIRQYEPLAAVISNSPGQKLVEYQLAVDKALTPVDWGSASAWCRGIVDVGVLGNKKALLADWKTGKRKPESDQLQLFAGLAFAHFPNLEVVQTAFVWLKEGKIDRKVFTKSDIPAIWQTFTPRVIRLERAYSDGKFPPKPSGLCSKWCPVPKSKCEFSGRK